MNIVNAFEQKNSATLDIASTYASPDKFQKEKGVQEKKWYVRTSTSIAQKAMFYYIYKKNIVILNVA